MNTDPVSAETKLAELSRIYETITPNEDGSFTSTHARHNLEGVLISLQADGTASNSCLNTVKRVISQLAEMESFLDLGERIEAVPVVSNAGLR